METGRQRLRTFLAFEIVTCATAVAAMLVVNVAIVESRWLLILAAMVGCAALVMLAALRPLRAGRLEHAVRWLAVGNWAIALASTAVATFVWPLMVLAALLPAVFAMPYTAGRTLVAYLVISLAASVGVAGLGLLQDATGFSGSLPEWVRIAVILVFTPFLGGMIAQLALENNAHLNAALATARAVNERLARSEERLAEQARELRASRARVVAATDRERRRIERDLHDGAQQRLVALSVRLSLARDLILRDPAQAGTTLDDLRADVKALQVELRQLAQGVYPPVLTQHGLAQALRSAVGRCPNPVELAVAEIGRHPSDIEAAVYFCCVEALQNATKHAGPSAIIRVRLALGDAGGIEFSVADDGPGWDRHAPTEGSGIVNMADRIGASGGTIDIVSSPGGGTVVTGWVPVPATPA